MKEKTGPLDRIDPDRIDREIIEIVAVSNPLKSGGNVVGQGYRRAHGAIQNRS